MSFPNCRIFGAALASWVAIFQTVPSYADTITLHPTADTTLIQVAPDANLGGADFFNAGTAGNGNRNRALLQFSLTEDIPAGATILNAYLSLDVIRQPAMDLQPATFQLRRVLTSWGEGDKTPAEEGSPGLGAPGTAGDATWLSRFVGGNSWSTPGGAAGVDFSARVSSTTFVYGIGEPVQFESTPELTADVQLWLDNPGANFGWMLLPEDERIRKSARSFASREDANGGPMLVIEFTPVPEPAASALIGVGLLALVCLRRRT